MDIGLTLPLSPQPQGQFLRAGLALCWDSGSHGLPSGSGWMSRCVLLRQGAEGVVLSMSAKDAVWRASYTMCSALRSALFSSAVSLLTYAWSGAKCSFLRLPFGFRHRSSAAQSLQAPWQCRRRDHPSRRPSAFWQNFLPGDVPLALHILHI